MRRLPLGYLPGAFCCRDEEIDGYLHDGNAAIDEETWNARTYGVEDGAECAGYFTVPADAIRLNLQEAQETHSRYQSVPAIKLGRIGTCKRYKKQGVGDFIFDVVVGLARSMAANVGVRYVSVDALPQEWLVNRHKKRGFLVNDGEEEHRLRNTPRNELDGDRVISMRLDTWSVIPAAIAGVVWKTRWLAA